MASSCLKQQHTHGRQAVTLARCACASTSSDSEYKTVPHLLFRRLIKLIFLLDACLPVLLHPIGACVQFLQVTGLEGHRFIMIASVGREENFCWVRNRGGEE